MASRGDAAAGQELHPGAAHRTLFRYPVIPAAYETFAGNLAVEDNPFELKSDFIFDVDLEAQQAKIIGPLLLAACGENHVLLQRAWRAVIDAGTPPEALAELTGLPFDRQTANDLGVRYEQDAAQADALAAEWRAMFRAKYEKVLASLSG